jgi:hypothetical protein
VLERIRPRPVRHQVVAPELDRLAAAIRADDAR